MKDDDLLKSYWKVYKYRQEIPFEKLPPEFQKDLSESLHFRLYKFSCAWDEVVNAFKKPWIKFFNTIKSIRRS